VKTKEGKKSYHVSDLIAYESAAHAAYDLGDDGDEDYEDLGENEDEYAEGGELESKKQNLLEYLNNFPKNAESWRQATDEVRDIARMARITYLEVDEKEYEPLDFKTLKTPSEWNTLGREYIIDMYNRMSDEAKKEFLDAFEHTFQDIKVGDNIRIKEGLYLSSLMNLEGEDLEVKKITRYDFASGTKKYYHVEFDGDKYEVREDFVDNERMEHGGELPTITKKEWSKKLKDNKLKTKDGKYYVMKYDDKKGTYLQQVKVLEDGGMMADGGTITDSYEVFYFDADGEKHTSKPINANSEQEAISKFENDSPHLDVSYAKKIMADGGEVYKAGELKFKIEKILDKVLPGFYKNVFVRKNYFDNGEYIGIIMAASNYEINRVKGQYPQDVSLMLDVNDMDLHVQVFGGNGGNRIYLVPDKNDPKEKYLAMAGVKIQFRTPKKEEKFVLQAIEKFAENYKIALKENKDRLFYKEYVDYDTLIMANGGKTNKKITVIVYNDKKLNYTNQDIQEIIDDIDMYMTSDNLPKWLIAVSRKGNPNFPKNKEQVKSLLTKIKNSNEDVLIDVDDNKPAFKNNIIINGEQIMADGGETKTQKTVKLTLLNKDSDNYTYKLDGTTGTAGQITFAFGKEPFQYDVKKISKSLESSQQDILDAFTIQGIKQHEYKGGFTEAIKHLDTKVVYEKKMASGGMTAGRYYKDNNGKEFRFIGESEGKLLFKDGEKIVTKTHEDFEDAPKEYKLFGIFADGGETIAGFPKDYHELNMNFLKIFKEYGFINSKEYGNNTYINEIGDIIIWSPKTNHSEGHLRLIFNKTYTNFDMEVLNDFQEKHIDYPIYYKSQNYDKWVFYVHLNKGKESNYNTKSLIKLFDEFNLPKGERIGKLSFTPYYSEGGETTFEDKVKAVQKNLLKKKKVPAIVQKDYGKTYSKEEAKESAQRIIGSQTAKWNAKNKMAKGGKTAISSLKDKIIGSKKNKPGTASSKTSAKDIELNDSIVEALSEKAKEYNKKHSNKVSTSTLKAVMRRGMGAFSSSHRPGMTRQGWGFARVNKFLLKKGGTKVKAAYVQDDDLLENGGELKKEMKVSEQPKFKKLQELQNKISYSQSRARDYEKWREGIGANYENKWNKMIKRLRGWNDYSFMEERKTKPEWKEYCKENSLNENYDFGDVLA
jgi:hypothetical protein